MKSMEKSANKEYFLFFAFVGPLSASTLLVSRFFFFFFLRYVCSTEKVCVSVWDS